MWDWKQNANRIELSLPKFYCPNCNSRRSYLMRPASEVALLHVIGLFEAKDLTDVVECQGCENGFDPEILKNSNQRLFKLVPEARAQLARGVSPQSLTLKLMGDGLNEEFIHKLILSAQN